MKGITGSAHTVSLSIAPVEGLHIRAAPETGVVEDKRCRSAQRCARDDQMRYLLNQIPFSFSSSSFSLFSSFSAFFFRYRS
jgi:hypothetical protein